MLDGLQTSIDVAPRSEAVLVHIIGSDAVGDALETKTCDQPVEYLWRISLADCFWNAVRFEFSLDVIQKGC